MASLAAGNSSLFLGSCRSLSIRDYDIEIWAGSPSNPGFQTPRTSGIKTSLVGSGLSPVNRKENLLWTESGNSSDNVRVENGSSKCSASKLKRKRPQRMDILLQLPDLNSLFSAVEQAKEVNVEGFHYAVSSKKGRREFMEDTHKAIANVLGDSEQAFFGVFDGHSGRKASDFAAENIGQNIVNAMVDMGDETENILEQAVKAGYLTTDAEFLKQNVYGGTACVTALIIDGNLVVSNAGDCRAVLSRNAASEALTCDHRAGREDERQRIQGSLAVTRAIGDSHMKEWIMAEPETRKIPVTSDCEFLILASDGLWDVVSNQEAVDIARPFCVENQPNSTPLGGGPIAACKRLVEVAVTRKSHDDISVMIVQLRHFCKK